MLCKGSNDFFQNIHQPNILHVQKNKIKKSTKYIQYFSTNRYAKKNFHRLYFTSWESISLQLIESIPVLRCHAHSVTRFIQKISKFFKKRRLVWNLSKFTFETIGKRKKNSIFLLSFNTSALWGFFVCCVGGFFFS